MRMTLPLIVGSVNHNENGIIVKRKLLVCRRTGVTGGHGGNLFNAVARRC
jgi:hypothetical protein